MTNLNLVTVDRPGDLVELARTTYRGPEGDIVLTVTAHPDGGYLVERSGAAPGFIRRVPTLPAIDDFIRGAPSAVLNTLIGDAMTANKRAVTPGRAGMRPVG